MTKDFITIARGRRIEALTARSLLLCERHERPQRLETSVLDKLLRVLGL